MRGRLWILLGIMLISVLVVGAQQLRARQCGPVQTDGATARKVYVPIICIPSRPRPSPTAPAPSSTVAAPTATTVATPTTTSVPPTAPPLNAVRVTQLAVEGPGFSDVEVHQIVRTSGDVVYIFAPEIYQPYVRAFRARNPGTPTGFSEVDATNRPTQTSNVWAVDAAIDAQGVVHLVAIAEDGAIFYTTFDTRMDTWGQSVPIGNSAWPNRNNDLRQGSVGVALALDANGAVHVVYNTTEGSLRRLAYRMLAGGSWTPETIVDDQPSADNSHPALAFGEDGTLYLAWLADNGTQGMIRVRARRNGVWNTASQIDDNVFRNNGYSVDQGPSLIVTPNGDVHVAYIGPYERIPAAPTGYDYGRLRHKYSVDGGVTWINDDPPLRYTHNPALATDAAGTLYLFGQREYWQAQNCADLLVVGRAPDGPWDTWRTLATGCYDSSVSVKWSQYNWNQPNVLDLIYWTEQGPEGESNLNQLQYTEVRGGLDALATLDPVPAP